jgi:hypothetical protein
VASPDATISDAIGNNQNGVRTIQQWRNDHCANTSEFVSTQLGAFVYHHHILEHEDGHNGADHGGAVAEVSLGDVICKVCISCNKISGVSYACRSFCAQRRGFRPL